MSQVQTESVNLAVVMESGALGANPPPATGWFNLEPNSYGKIGAGYKKLPRDPISKNQQLQKGMLVDEDSGVDIEMDVTMHHVNIFAPGIYRSATKHSGGTGLSQFFPSAVVAGAPGHFAVVSGGALQAGVLLFSRDFIQSANDGLLVVAAGSSATQINVTGLVNEASPPTKATVDVAGFRGASGDIQMDSGGNLTSTVLDFTTLGLNEFQWIGLGGRTAGTTFATASFAVKASMDMATETTNVNSVIEAVLGGSAGNAITLELVESPAAPNAGVMTNIGKAYKFTFKGGTTTVTNFETAITATADLEVKTAGTGANILAAGVDEFSPENLEGGADIVGTNEYQGVARIAKGGIAANKLTLERRSWTVGAADNGAGKTIEIYFSRFWRNVAIGNADYLSPGGATPPSYAFEITYPGLDAGTDEYEYPLGNVPDEWVWNFPITSKATINAKFMGTRTPNISTARNAGPSTAVDPSTKAGVSTAQDIARLRISNVDETGVSTDFQSLKITTKNNVSPQKELGVLGATFMNTGKHEVLIEAEVIFTSDEAILAVRDNRTMSLDVLVRNGDFGALIDVQSMTMDSTDRKFEKNKAVLLTTKATGFQNDVTGSTESLSMFAFIPNPTT